MKKQLLLVFITFFALQLFGQIHPPYSFIDLQGNNIQARIPNGGTLFNDGINGHFIPNPTPDENAPSTMFTAGFWIGGVDPAGNLKLAAATYWSSTKGDFYAGPLHPDGTTTVFDCNNWDRHFMVRGSEIVNFLANLSIFAGNPAAAIAQYPGIMGWPARGNAYFSTIWGYDLPQTNQSLAGFVDKNGNGLYEPLLGDYPAVLLKGKAPIVPAMIVWSVFNDEGAGSPHGITNGKTLQIEVQQTAWAFNCPDKPILNNTVFTSHKIINRSVERLDSTYIGIWTDFDLGCYTDDYVGSNPGVGFFAYNQDAIDGNLDSSCMNNATFGNHPPVQSVTFLSQKMDNMIAFDGSNHPWVSDPASPAGYYAYQTGRFLDGVQPSEGGNGYNPGSGAVPVNYMYPGDPADPNAWSMCSSNSLVPDVRALGSTKIGAMLPGAVEELTLAWTVHPNPALPCGLGTMYDDVNWLKDFYANDFPGLCSSLTKAPEPVPDTLELFPNPAINQFTLTYGNMKISELRLYAADGRWVRTLKNLPNEKVIVPVQDLTTGMYELQLITDQGNFIRKLSIAR